MESIEQLKQDNTKLQERLNNAAKFFREQKAQIEELTAQVKERTTLALDYRNQIETLTNENKQLKDQVESCEFAAESDSNNLEDLQKQLNEYELKLESTEKVINEQKEKYENKITLLEEENIKLSESKHLLDECAKKLSNAEAAYEELRKKYKDNDIARGEAELKISNLQSEYEKIFNKQDKEIKDLNTQVETLKNKFEEEGKNNVVNKTLLEENLKTIESKNKAYKILQDTYNEVFSENTNLKNSLTSKNKEYTDLLHDFKIEEEAHKKDIELKNKFSDSCEDLNKSNVELQDKLNKLNKLYDDCEAEKLGAEAENEKLKEYIKNIELNNISDKEWEKHLEDVITQIRDLADDIINPKSINNDNKENVMKRTGDYNVSGENIGI